jgi:hypothetical protein
MTGWWRKRLWLIPVSMFAFETTGFGVDGMRFPPPPAFPGPGPVPLPASPPPPVPGEALPPPGMPAVQFISTIQVAVQEETPELMQRSQRLVRQQLAAAFSGRPEFRGKHYELRTEGNNEVILSLVSDNDVRPMMRQTVENFFQNMSGSIQGKAQWLYSRASLAPQMGGYLEVVVDDTHTKVRSISAQGVSFRDLLKEVRFQLGSSLSYLIPGECAQRPVDWSFGDEAGSAAPAKNVDALMNELATLFNLKCENKNGTYIFSGNCNDLPPTPARLRAGATPADFFREALAPPMRGNAAPHNVQTQVYFPLLPLE